MTRPREDPHQSRRGTGREFAAPADLARQLADPVFGGGDVPCAADRLAVIIPDS